MSEPLAPDPCVFPPQHSAIPSVSAAVSLCHAGQPTLPVCLFTYRKLLQEIGRAAFSFVSNMTFFFILLFFIRAQDLILMIP